MMTTLQEQGNDAQETLTPTHHTNYTHSILLYVNGVKHQLSCPNPELTLSQYLRNELRLTGTKIGCNEGGCGSCVVMIQHFDHGKQRVVSRSVNSCLFPLIECDGCHVVTVEGVGSSRDDMLHLIQRRIREFNGSQCGFCTPGFVMSLYTLLRNNPKPSLEEIERALDGNLCRCTGYRPILDAARSLVGCGLENCCQTNNSSSCSSKGCGMKDCCQNRDGNDCCKDVNDNPITEKASTTKADPLFPFELRTYKYKPLRVTNARSLTHATKPLLWYRPTTLENFLEILQRHPNEHKRFIVGNTEIAIEQRMKNKHFPVVIQPTHIQELLEMKAVYNGDSGEASHLILGASVTLASMEQFLREQRESLPPHQGKALDCILDQLKYFASTSIRNTACLAGNIVTASPVSDLNPLWMALDCKLKIMHMDGQVKTIEFKDFFIGYRQVQLKKSELIIHMVLPLPSVVCKNSNDSIQTCDLITKAYKQSKRREDDIAVVTAGMKIRIEHGSHIVRDIRLVYGGMNAYTVSAEKTRSFLIGKPFSKQVFEDSLNFLDEDLPLDKNAPGGMVEYRKTLSMSFYFKFYLYVTKTLNIRELTEDENSVLLDQYYIERHFPIGKQLFKPLQIGASVGQPLPHQSAHLQVSGEAKFVDDILPFYGEVYAALVLSTKPLAKIVSVNVEKALQMNGVLGFVDHRDVKGVNKIGVVIPQEEELFKSQYCTSTGQLIGLIVAETELQAKNAAREVVIEYETLQDQKPIFTIREALEQKSFHVKEKKISSQAPSLLNPQIHKHAPELIQEIENNLQLTKDYVIVEGDTYTNTAQEHFYVEPYAALVIPNFPELGEYQVYCTTQDCSHTQMTVAEVLNIPSNKVVASVKRLGGGFGGKESKPTYLAAAIAVAAQKFQRPIRIILDRDVDMSTTGQRHPFFAKYKTALNRSTLKIQALDIELVSNGGYSMDLSESVLNRAMQSVDNCYFIPAFKITGRVCKTNVQSNTAFRGFGGPQSFIAIETVIDHLSHTLSNQLDASSQLSKNPSQLALAIREANFYSAQHSTTPFQMKIEDIDRIHTLWNQTKECSNYEERLKEIENFNSKHRYRKKGISMLPVKFGIAFGAPFLNQGGAFINIYHNDGSVLLSTGGVCMGQGLFIKLIQCASTALGIPPELIHIKDTSSDKTPNMSATAASVSSDLYGQAVINACNVINKRLDALKKELFPELFSNYILDEKNKLHAPPVLTKEQWTQLVEKAYFKGDISLSATGFYHTSQVWMDWTNGVGRPFEYFTYGCAASEVEIDTLTGDWTVKRTDIVMDVGNSINPSIDIGQIEGAFIQGMGLFTMEEFMWGDESHTWIQPGQCFTKGPGAYKIPSAGDIPCEFNVHLLKDSFNPKATYSSKGIGEPPLSLGATVFFAIKQAVESARRDVGISSYCKLEPPATTEKIRVACYDKFVERFAEDEKTRIKCSY
nr:unnamed protein product [Naegleria fowleri]